MAVKHPLGTQKARQALADAIVAVCVKHGGTCTVEPSLLLGKRHGLTLCATFNGAQFMCTLDMLHKDGTVLLHWHHLSDDLLDRGVFGYQGGYRNGKATTSAHAQSMVQALDDILARFKP